MVALLGFFTTAQAGVIWDQDFSNVSNWYVGNDPSGGSSITTTTSNGLQTGTYGAFYVNGASTEATFVPINTGTASLVLFDQANKNDYSLNYTVSVWWSNSYDIALDQFDASGTFIGTIWSVVPTTSAPGWNGGAGEPFPSTSYTVSLGSFTFDANTAYLMPKIDVQTGAGGQTVFFSELNFSVVPEPAMSALILVGLGLLICRRRLAHSRYSYRA